MTLDEKIDDLDDIAAERLLQRIARSQPAVAVPATLDASLRSELAELLDIDDAAVASKGDLARTALRLLGQEPHHREGIAALIETPEAERFAAVETALLVSAVLIVLQTHLSFERDKDGKWAVKLEKKPTSSNLLAELVRKLISFS